MNESHGFNRLITDAGRKLEAAGCAQARHEAEWALSALLGIEPLELYLRPRALSDEARSKFWAIIAERAQGQPLQYLLGETEFCGLRFAIRPGVFIPRPETESVVQTAIAAFGALALHRPQPLRLVEFGVGSGCIAVTLAKAFPACRIVGVEVSWDACALVLENAGTHGVMPQLQLIQGSWDEALTGLHDGIIANPPYVPSAQVERLPLDVRQEPHRALDGGGDGLRDVRRVLAAASRLLRPDGIAILECGEEQVDRVIQDVRPAPWVSSVTALHDLAHRPRGVIITRMPAEQSADIR